MNHVNDGEVAKAKMNSQDKQWQNDWGEIGSRHKRWRGGRGSQRRLHPSWLVVGVVIIIILAVTATQILNLSKSAQAAEFLAQFYNKTVTISGKIAKDPSLSEQKLAITLTDLKIDGNEVAGKIYLTFTTFSTSKTTAGELAGTEEDPERADLITLSGELKSGFGTFVATIQNPTVLELRKSGDVFLKIRKAFAKQIKKYVGTTNEAGLELGYLLGMKNEIDAEFEEALRIVGLTHIIVASGTHLGILVGFGRKIFGKISRFAGFLVAVGLIIVFVGITGLTPSMMRAAFVALLSLVAWYYGRDAASWRILLYAAAVTLAIEPENLLDLAWQLSLGSFAGLMLISPILTKFFYGRREPGFIGGSLITSLSTMLCCAPILIYNFGSISLISVVANLLILPTIAPVMGLGVATGISGLIGFGIVAKIFGFLTSIILKYHIFIINFLSKQKVFVVEVAKNNALVFLLWIIPIGLVVFSFWKKKRRKIFFE